MPPASPAPKPGAKRLPLWAWGAAAAVGILIGIFLLKRQPGGGEDDGGSPEDLSQGEGGGGSVVAPLDEQLLQGMGLRPSEHSDGGFQFFGDDGGGGDPSFDTSTYQGLIDYENYYGELPPGTYRRDPPGYGAPEPEPPPAPPPAPLPPPPSTPPPRSGGPPGAA